MKNFNEMLEMVQDEKVILCKASSGHYVAYEPVKFVGFTRAGKLRFITENGVRFMAEELYGKFVLTGKAKNFFIHSAEDANRENYFLCDVLD